MNTRLTIIVECTLPNDPTDISPVVERDSGNDLDLHLGGWGRVETGSNIGSFVGCLKFPKRMGEKLLLGNHKRLPLTKHLSRRRSL
jgi:hypothetical protein